MSDEIELYDIPPAFQNRLLKWLDKTGEALTITALFKDSKSSPSVPHFLVTPSEARGGSSEHRSLEHALNHAMGSRAETRYIAKKFEKRVHAWLADSEGRIVIRGAGNDFVLTLAVPGASVEVSDEDLEVALVIAEDELEIQGIEPEPETREAVTRAAPTRHMTFDEEPETIAAPTRMAETRAAATRLFGGDTDRTMREAGLEPNPESDYPEEFAQGARCGHLEGKGRAGQYVVGEEIRLAEEATDAQGLPRRAAREWCAGYTHGYRLAAEGAELESEYREPWLEENAQWSRAYINSLPDSAFLHVEPGGKKDRIGRSHPLSLRHLPYRNRSGRVDRAHLRAAISRAHQEKTKLPPRVKEQAIRHAQEIYRREFGGDDALAANASRPQRPRSSLRGRELPSTDELIEREEARRRREERPFDPEERRESYARPHHFAVNERRRRRTVVPWSEAFEDVGGYPYAKSETGRYILFRDSREVLRGTEQEIWRSLHQHPYSVEHALRYEGYHIEPEVPVANEGRYVVERYQDGQWVEAGMVGVRAEAERFAEHQTRLHGLKTRVREERG